MGKMPTWVQKHILVLRAKCCCVCRPLTLSDGSEDELLLLGVLMSSSSILVSGLDGATWSLWTSELLCSVSSYVYTG